MRRKPLTIEQIEKKLCAGSGSGKGVDYKPYITVQNVPSSTTVTRIRGLTIKRIYHLLSFLEVACFYILDSCEHVVDIREQVPLITLNNTMDIARRLGIIHPGLYRGGKNPQLMTTDLLIDVIEEGRIQLIALCVKPSGLLNNKRVREKLELERFYWLERGIEWKIVTEKDISLDLVKNLEWIYTVRNWYSEKPPYPVDDIACIERPLLETLIESKLPLSTAALEIDRKYKLSPGTSLDMFRYLVAMGFWKVDMLNLIDTSKPIVVSRNVDFSIKGVETGVSYNCS